MQESRVRDEAIAGLPINAWKTVFVFSAIPDLINLGKAIPSLTHFLDRARNWGVIYSKEYKGSPNVDFTFFSNNWRRLYTIDTRGRVPEMDRGKLNVPVETLTECLIQGTNNELYMSSNFKDTKLKSSTIQGGSGTCWSGRQLWIRDKNYTLQSVTTEFDIGCAAQIGGLVYLYSPQLGIVEADVPTSSSKHTLITTSHVRSLIEPNSKVTQLCPTSSGLVYLSESGNIYKESEILSKGEYTKIVRLNNGVVALSNRGTLWNSLYDEANSYNEPIKDICVSLDKLLAVGSSGHLYVLDNRQGLSIKDLIGVPGQVLGISPGFFTRYVYAIVSPNAPNLGKRSLKTKLKSGYRAIKSDTAYAMAGVGAGLFI